MERTNLPNIQCEPDPNYLPRPPRHPNTQYQTIPWPQSNPQRHVPVSRRASSTSRAPRKPSIAHNTQFARQRPNQSFADNSVIDPSLETITNLSGYPPQVPSNSVTPIHRFYYESESPWNTVRFGQSLNVPERGSPYPPLDLNYRSGPNSEIESHETAPYASDSGYGTIDCTTQSVFSLPGADHTPQDCPDLPYRVETMQFPEASAAEPQNDAKDVIYKFDNMERKFPRPSSSVTSRSKPALEKCKVCGEIPKCPSDFKKHMLKHDKPFKCTVAGCKKKGGFTTINDLRRHEKSVHKIGTTDKSYRCASLQCKNRHKIWPRLDNFKQHVHRMHQEEEDLDDFIKRSQWDGRASPQRPTTIVAPMETTLAGIDDPSKHASMGMFQSSNSYPITFDHGSKPWDSVTSNPQTIDFEDSSQDQNEVPTFYGHHPHGAASGSSGATRSRRDPLFPRSDMVSTTASSSGLTALADAACGSGGMNNPPDDPSPRPGPTGSRRPHQQQPTPSPQLTRLSKETDEDRQKRALGKLSSVIADGISRSSQSKGEALNETILRILTSATGLPLPNNKTLNDMSQSAPGRIDQPIVNPASENPPSGSSNPPVNPLDVAQGLAAVAAMMKRQRPKKGNTLVSRQSSGLSTNAKKCSVCSQSFNRNCDLKKHMKRHDRPYGCTYPKCHKIFGSKSDWKRHENSQHFQIETWRCQMMSPAFADNSSGSNSASRKPAPSQHCGSLFFRQEQFKEHLQKHHSVTDDAQVEREVKSRRIGRNGQGRFWCGFCGDIIELKEKRTAAWDERFNHIDDHFKAGLSAKQWWCMEAKKTKGEVEKLMNKQNFDDEEDEEGEGDDDDESGEDIVEIYSSAEELSPTSSSAGSSGDMHASLSAAAAATTEQSSVVPTPGTSSSSIGASGSGGLGEASTSRKRQRSREDSPLAKPKKKKFTLLNCCLCDMGPFDRKMYSACLQCEHQFCSRCSRMSFEQRPEE